MLVGKAVEVDELLSRVGKVVRAVIAEVVARDLRAREPAPVRAAVLKREVGGDAKAGLGAEELGEVELVRGRRAAMRGARDRGGHGREVNGHVGDDEQQRGAGGAEGGRALLDGLGGGAQARRHGCRRGKARSRGRHAQGAARRGQARGQGRAAAQLLAQRLEALAGD